MAADIRPARASDVDELVALENASFSGDRISPRSFRRLIASRSAAVLVAGARMSTKSARIEGYCVTLFRSGSRLCRLYSIAVRADAGGAGVGRGLLGAAEREGSRRGATALRLEVREDNARAIRLYEMSGYRGIGRIAGYYADGAAARRYEKLLPAATAGAGTAHP